jgi:membrane protease YdiL (CAAX protease family)
VSRTRCFLLIAAVLGVYNVVRAFGVFSSFELPAVLVLVAVVAAIARSAGMDANALALERADARRGARLGVAAFLVISAVLVVIAAIPATRDFLDDDRADVSTAAMLYELCVPILLVTVLPEEFVFRGALLGSVLEEWGARRAALASSVLFGLWHISPTLNTLADNDQLHGATTSGPGRFGLVAGSVVATFVAGLGFSWLRLRSRSLVAPVCAHLATNGTAFFLAWLVVR